MNWISKSTREILPHRATEKIHKPRTAADFNVGQKLASTLCFLEQYHINFGMKEKPHFCGYKRTIRQFPFRRPEINCLRIPHLAVQAPQCGIIGEEDNALLTISRDSGSIPDVGIHVANAVLCTAG
jgi:hypothetical protein